MKNWNYDYLADAAAPVYFDVWSDIFYDLTWDEFANNKPYNLLKPDAWRTAFFTCVMNPNN
ncbi:MAG: hypothetical protein HC817_12940, partial [Saprospiraceae bacterium]|nr:hypothetical protein [Saprospiraceae bacterium]